MTHPAKPTSDSQAAPVPEGGTGLRRHVTSEADKAKAQKWFKHAKTVSDSKNYDYAVELYVNGLALWPDAVEEALRPLRVVATARRLNRGKPAGFLEVKKRSLTGKDSLKNLSNAIYLFGMDPVNLLHMEGILQAAARAGCDRTVQWIAPVMVETMMSEKKLPEKRYADACRAMEVAADLATAATDYRAATEILQAGLRVAQIWSQHHGDSSEAQRAYSSASSKQTIVKGRFGTGEDFRDSLRDATQQADIRDKDTVVQSADRNLDLLTKARKAWAENPDTPAKLVTLTDLLIRREEDEPENEAIALLEKEYAAHGSYSMKVKADDIRMRQMKRNVRRIQTRLKADPDSPEIRRIYAKYLAHQNKTEIEIYRERAEHYPTDLHIRFELGLRYFKAKAYDDAIPLFQQAQADGRHRSGSRLYIGRCFFEKGFHTQAIETLRSAFEAAESKTGDMAKDLNYWLARALEASGDAAQAQQSYGQLIQLDYNFKDARQRLEALQAAAK